MDKIKFASLIILIPAEIILADTRINNPPLNVRTQNGNITNYPYQLQLPNNSLTDNNNGTMTVNFSSSDLVGGSTQYIQNTNTLQGATFYTSSGTATNLNTTTLKFNDGTTQITAAAGGAATIIAVGTGTASNFTTVITSPTNNVSFLGSQFGSLTNGTTNFISILPAGLFPLSAPNGSASSPSYSFSANANQGMYSVDSNHLDFSVGGSKAGAFDFNIGEFVLGSNYAFALAGTSSSPQFYQIGDRATGIAFPGTNNMTLRTGGSTAVNLTANQVAVQTGYTLYVPVGSASTPRFSFASNGGGLYSPGANIIGFTNGSIETARIDAAGNIGINTTITANAQLSIKGSSINSYELVTSTASSGPFHLDVSTTGHINTQGLSPSISSCGAAPVGSISSNATDFSGTVTVGGGVVTSCVVTFATPFNAAPDCLVDAGSSSISAGVTTQGSSSFTVGFSATLGGGKFTYICPGHD
jgi:hypothetical protein